MKKYNIVVNGISYEVEVEEVGASQTPTTPIASPAATPAQPAPAKAAAPAAPAATSAAPSAGTQTIDCPMPGTILDIKVKPGDTVAEGQIILILEAMKMENEIVAPAAGTIDTVQVTKGSAVNAGDILVSIK